MKHTVASIAAARIKRETASLLLSVPQTKKGRREEDQKRQATRLVAVPYLMPKIPNITDGSAWSWSICRAIMIMKAMTTQEQIEWSSYEQYRRGAGL